MLISWLMQQIPGKLNELTQQKEEAEAQLEEKMDRWVYLNDLAEQIETQK